MKQRQIDLRIWDKVNQTWLTSVQVSNTKIGHANLSFYAVQECTGEIDSTGRYIWEGDIVSVYIPDEYNNHGYYIATVEWVHGGFMMVGDFFGIDATISAQGPINQIKHSLHPGFQNATVIGNIFEHPEFLEK